MSRQVMPCGLRLKLAKECKNPLVRVKLTPQIKKFQYYLLHSSQIDDATFDRMMALFKILMQADYEKSSWGWNEKSKMAEFRHSRTRVILVTTSDTRDLPTNINRDEPPPESETLVGFMCLAFEHGGDKSECALYVYELQIRAEFQRQGLGEELMRMAEILAREFKMDKIMLTVFRSNEIARNFYKKLKFETDKSSPSKAESDYTILSRHLRTQKKS